MRRPGKIARAVKFYTSPLYYITSRLSSQGVWRNFFCFSDLKWYSAKLRASRSGVKFCARPDRRAVSNFIGVNQLEPAANPAAAASCKAAPSCVKLYQLQSWMRACPGLSNFNELQAVAAVKFYRPIAAANQLSNFIAAANRAAKRALIACQIYILIKLQLLSNFMRTNQLDIYFYI